MQSVAVIGGSGFIGTRLIRRLQRSPKFEVSILDKVENPEFNGITRLC
ncbi:MAG: UDP-N-acetylglucosamine 4-epimerase, partial [Pseudomonadota bacterium]